MTPEEKAHREEAVRVSNDRLPAGALLPYPWCPDPTWTRPLFSTAYRAKPAKAHFDLDAGLRFIEFTHQLHHFKGDFAGKSFDLLDWQVHEYALPMYGWKIGDCETAILEDTEDGPIVVSGVCTCPRLYRTSYLETAKKQGKTQVGAAIAGYGAFGDLPDRDQGAEVYTYAADKVQAKLAFDALSFGMFYESNPWEKRFPGRYKPMVSEIRNKSTRSFVRVQSSDVKTKHGPNAQTIVFDELHAQPNRDLWDVSTSGVAARRQPLIAALTTAGWDRLSICWEQHEHARMVSEGVLDDPSFLGIVYGAREEDDWTDPAVWYLAAPSLGVTVQEEFYVQKCREAVQMPTAQNSFRQLFLSQWTQQAVRAIPMDAWRACPAPRPLKELARKLAYGGFDLAATTDLAAFALIFPDTEGFFDSHVKFYMPEDNIKAKELRDRVPYSTWAEQGLITLTPGASIRYEFIIADILEAKKTYDLREIGYDPWNAVQVVQALERERVKLFPMTQGYKSLSPPTKELLRLIVEAKFRHKNKVLTWNADSCAAEGDAAGNIKLNKAKSSARIDGIVAVIMALDAALRNPPKRQGSIYDDPNLDPAGTSTEGAKRAP